MWYTGSPDLAMDAGNFGMFKTVAQPSPGKLDTYYDIGNPNETDGRPTHCCGCRIGAQKSLLCLLVVCITNMSTIN